jgi:CRP-like cAMP-binding protein
MYIMEQGNAQVEVDGKIVKTYARGDWFGELALLHNDPRRATVRASGSGECHLLKLNRASFERFGVAANASFFGCHFMLLQNDLFAKRQARDKHTSVGKKAFSAGFREFAVFKEW